MGHVAVAWQCIVPSERRGPPIRRSPPVRRAALLVPPRLLSSVLRQFRHGRAVQGGDDRLIAARRRSRRVAAAAARQVPEIFHGTASLLASARVFAPEAQLGPRQDLDAHALGPAAIRPHESLMIRRPCRGCHRRCLGREIAVLGVERLDPAGCAGVRLISSETSLIAVAPRLEVRMSAWLRNPMSPESLPSVGVVVTAVCGVFPTPGQELRTPSNTNTNRH